MTSKAITVSKYLKDLPEDRREAITAIRETILKNLDKGFQETVANATINYSVPHSIYPKGYHCDPQQPLPFASISNQKGGVSIHLFCIYGDEERKKAFQEEWKKAGKKLDMGAACVRVKKLEDVPLAVLGKTIKKIKLKDFVARYDAMRPRGK